MNLIGLDTKSGSYELLDLLTDIAITGKDLRNELDKINKPTELRVIYEK